MWHSARFFLGLSAVSSFTLSIAFSLMWFNKHSGDRLTAPSRDQPTLEFVICMSQESSKDVLELMGERREIIELAQFVLSRRTRDIRNELTNYLIARAIAEHEVERQGVLERDLAPLIKLDYGLPDFPELFIRSALENIIAEKSLITKDSPEGIRYFLDEKKKTEMESINKRYQEVRKSAIDALLRRVRSGYGELSQHQEETIAGIFYSLMGSILAKQGVQCARAITYGRGQPSRILEYPDFGTQFEGLLSKISDQKLRGCISKGLRESFLNPSKDLLILLHSMAQGYVILQILNLDPNCIALEKASLAKKKVYLDTNIIIATICSGDESHRAVVDLVRLTKDLGVELSFTSRTKEELLGRFRESTDLYLRLSGVSSNVARKAMELISDPFIKSFRMEQMAGSGSAWDWFSAKMNSVEVICKDSHGIEFDQERLDEILSHPDLKQLTSNVYKAAYPNKTEKVAQHDAFHILLIGELRKKETPDELGTNHWFLTLDHTLERAERDFAREMGREQGLCCNIHASTWLDLISTFLSPDIAREEPPIIFARLLASELPSLTKPLDPYDIVDLIGPWMDDPSLETESLRRIVGNDFVRKTLGQLREAEVRGEQIDFGKAVSPIIDSVKHEIEERHASEREKDRLEVSELKKKLDELQRVSNQSTRMRKPMLVSGLLSFAAIVTFSLLEAFIKVHFPDTVYYCLTSLTIILLGAAAIGPSITQYASK